VNPAYPATVVFIILAVAIGARRRQHWQAARNHRNAAHGQ